MRRAHSARSWPWAANCRAISAPSPLLAPVIRIVSAGRLRMAAILPSPRRGRRGSDEGAQRPDRAGRGSGRRPPGRRRSGSASSAASSRNIGIRWPTTSARPLSLIVTDVRRPSLAWRRPLGVAAGLEPVDDARGGGRADAEHPAELAGTHRLVHQVLERAQLVVRQRGPAGHGRGDLLGEPGQRPQRAGSSSAPASGRSSRLDGVRPPC